MVAYLHARTHARTVPLSRLVFKKGLIWALSLALVAPPSLLAQTSGGASILPPVGGSAAGFGQGQPLITNPTALQPIIPANAPCPAPAVAPLTPLPPSPQLPPPGGTGQAGSGGTPLLQQQQGGGPSTGQTAASPRQGATGQQGGAALPLPGGLLGPTTQSQPPTGGGSPSRPEAVGPLSIEEAFARFFILQGVTGQLKQFGYSFFEVPFSGLPPTMDTPVGPDYVIGPDDTLAIHVWNVPDASFNRSYITPVERDGTVFIPHVGAIPVAGSTFSQATRVIQARLATLLKRFELHVSMARLRTIKVYVVGEVVRPGAYEVSSLATASHALYAACGPAKSGSLRSIQVVREGKPIATLDFYRFFLYGDRTHDIRLQSGDTVLVPPIGPVVAIGGPVKRPAIYELRGATTLTGLIDLAGGLTPTADRQRCQVFRVQAGQKRVILDVELGGLLDASDPAKAGSRAHEAGREADVVIQDGDFVRLGSVPTQIENAVTLDGAVRNPGPYEFKPGMRLRDLLTPEQMLVDSYLDQAELARTDPMTYETTVIRFSPKRLFEGVEGENLPLQRLDHVTVATQARPARSVTVAGEVKRPGTYAVANGERLSSVLKRAGGFTARAFPQGLILVRESVKRSQQAEVEKFVSLQKQRLVAEAAALAAGNVNPQGAMAGGMSPEQAALQMQMQALDQLIARLQPGRVVVKMESLTQLEGSAEDLVLEEGDAIMVPPRPQTVTVVGAVRNPVSVVHQEGLAVKEYIEQAGGMTRYAEKSGVYILRANGSTDAAYVNLRDVGPGDTIVVPEDIEPKARPVQFWTAVASVLGSLMLGAAAIAVIGR